MVLSVRQDAFNHSKGDDCSISSQVLQAGFVQSSTSMSARGFGRPGGRDMPSDCSKRMALFAAKVFYYVEMIANTREVLGPYVCYYSRWLCIKICWLGSQPMLSVHLHHVTTRRSAIISAVVLEGLANPGFYQKPPAYLLCRLRDYKKMALASNISLCLKRLL